MFLLVNRPLKQSVGVIYVNKLSARCRRSLLVAIFPKPALWASVFYCRSSSVEATLMQSSFLYASSLGNLSIKTSKASRVLTVWRR